MKFGDKEHLAFLSKHSEKEESTGQVLCDKCENFYCHESGTYVQCNAKLLKEYSEKRIEGEEKNCSGFSEI